MTDERFITIDELWEFLNLSNGLFCILGKDGYLKHVNASFTTLLGYTPEELKSKHYTFFIHPDDILSTENKFTDLINGEALYSFQNRYISSNGQYHWLSWTAIVPNERGGIYCVAQDQTDKVKLEEQLMEERLMKEKTVLEATIYGKEMERVELGRELHDNINQMLSTVKLYFDIANSNTADQKEILVKGKSLVEEIIEEIRILSQAMVGPEIRTIKLKDSIQDLIDTTLIKKGHNVLYDFSINALNVLPRIRLTIFRIVQEQVTNILKHAMAKNVYISLSDSSGFLELEITDDGMGFEPTKNKNGIGLNNIYSRVALLEGSAEIDSSPGTGCRMIIRFPFASIEELPDQHESLC